MTDNTEVVAVSPLDLKIEDATAAVKAAQEKLDNLLAQKANEDKIEALAVGQTVTAKYGRGEKVRDVTGVITAIGNDEKLGKLVALTVGEGLDSSIVKVRAADVKFS